MLNANEIARGQHQRETEYQFLVAQQNADARRLSNDDIRLAGHARPPARPIYCQNCGNRIYGDTLPTSSGYIHPTGCPTKHAPCVDCGEPAFAGNSRRAQERIAAGQFRCVPCASLHRNAA